MSIFDLNSKLSLSAVAMTIALAGCGGGGSGKSSTPTTPDDNKTAPIRETSVADTGILFWGADSFGDSTDSRTWETELWTIKNDQATKVKNINGVANSASFAGSHTFIGYDGYAYFFAFSSEDYGKGISPTAKKIGLYKTDGTEAGTSLVVDEAVPCQAGNSDWLGNEYGVQMLGSRIYFVHDSCLGSPSTHGSIYSIDLAASNPTSIQLSSDDVKIYGDPKFAQVNDKLYFAAAGELGSLRSLFELSGTTIKSLISPNASPDTGISIQDVEPLGDELYVTNATWDTLDDADGTNDKAVTRIYRYNPDASTNSEKLVSIGNASAVAGTTFPKATTVLSDSDNTIEFRQNPPTLPPISTEHAIKNVDPDNFRMTAVGDKLYITTSDSANPLYFYSPSDNTFYQTDLGPVGFVSVFEHQGNLIAQTTTSSPVAGQLWSYNSDGNRNTDATPNYPTLAGGGNDSLWRKDNVLDIIDGNIYFLSLYTASGHAATDHIFMNRLNGAEDSSKVYDRHYAAVGHLVDGLYTLMPASLTRDYINIDKGDRIYLSSQIDSTQGKNPLKVDLPANTADTQDDQTYADTTNMANQLIKNLEPTNQIKAGSIIDSGRF